MNYRSIEELYRKVIPPSDFEHRNGFDNIPILEKLDRETILELESLLLTKLERANANEIDTLIVVTLAFLHTKRAVPVLEDLLNKCDDARIRIVLAFAIDHISGNSSMVQIALTAANKILAKGGPYLSTDISASAYYLAEFRSEEIDRFLLELSRNADIIVASNAKRALSERL